MMDHKQEAYKCPNCGTELEAIIACGAESYFCNECKVPISRKRIEGHPNYEANKKV